MYMSANVTNKSCKFCIVKRIWAVHALICKLRHSTNLRGLHLLRHVHKAGMRVFHTDVAVTMGASSHSVEKAGSWAGVWFVHFSWFCESERSRQGKDPIQIISIWCRKSKEMQWQTMDEAAYYAHMHACMRTSSTCVPFAQITTSVILSGAAAEAA